MNYQKNFQAGSAHAIVVIVLVVALLGALGFVFWQNFIVKNDKVNNENAAIIQKDTKDKTNASKEYCHETAKLCFAYPSSWKLKESTETREAPISEGSAEFKAYTVKSASVSSSSGEVTVYLDMGMGQLGGACNEAEYKEDSLEIVSVKKLAIETDIYEGLEEYLTKQLYVVKTVTAIDGEYTPATYVTNKKTLQNPGIIGYCNSMFSSVFTQKYNPIPGYGQMQLSTIALNTTRGEIQNFSSRTAAINKLNSSDFQQAYEIISSAHYKN